jgi:hypothetical protein
MDVRTAKAHITGYGRQVMDWRNPKSVETRIVRLKQEIGQIESFLYDLDAQKERMGVAALLEHKRDDLVRAAVLQIHTAIEDLLTQIILYCALGITKEKYKNRLRSDKAKAFRRMLYGGGSLSMRSSTLRLASD